MRIRTQNIHRTLVSTILFCVLASGCGGSSVSVEEPASQTDALNHDHDNVEHGALPNASNIHWFRDDFEAARLHAEKNGVPLLIDVWATWCQPCVEMHRHVFTSERLEPYSDRFVWLRLNIEDNRNRFPFHLFETRLWPTHIIVRPGDEIELLRYEGIQSVDQMVAFLEKGLSRFGTDAADHEDTEKYYSFFRKARQATFEERHEDAVEFLEEARDLLPDNADVSALRDLLIVNLAAAADFESCVATARSLFDEDLLTESCLDLLETSVACAAALPDDNEAAAEFLKTAAASLEEQSTDTSRQRSPELTNRIFKARRKLLLLNGKMNAAKRVAAMHATFLEKESAGASTESEAMIWDRDRAEVALFLGDTDEIGRILRARAEELPNHYEPHLNFAWFGLETGNLEAALESARHAVSVAPDPERGEVLFLLADIYRARSEQSSELEVRQFLVEYYRTLPAALTPAGAIRRAESALKSLEKN